MKKRACYSFFFILSILILNQDSFLLSKNLHITHFGFRIFDFGNVKPILINILNREVAILVNEQLSPGTYVVEWDGSSFASGVYFYSLATSEFIETKKLILLK